MKHKAAGTSTSSPGTRCSSFDQESLKGLCSVADAIGMSVIALDVEHQTDLPLLTALGFDGVTGPCIK